MTDDTGAPVPDGRFARLIAWARRRRPGERRPTAEEARLQRKAAALEAELAHTAVELRKAESEAEIAKHEIKLLTEVVRRDRARVEAETAGFQRVVADATGHKGK
jgi:hypothetical protein